MYDGNDPDGGYGGAPGRDPEEHTGFGALVVVACVIAWILRGLFP